MKCSSDRSHLMEDTRPSIRSQREEIRKKKGCVWNPLNLLGGSGFKSGKDLNCAEREELHKRVRQIEQRLCYITDKIDQCEQSRLEEDSGYTDADKKVKETRDVHTEHDMEPESDDKTHGKSSQNFMILLKNQKIKRRRQPMPVRAERALEKRRKALAGESKSMVWNHKPCLDADHKTFNNNNFVNKFEIIKRPIQKQNIIRNAEDKPKNWDSRDGDQVDNRILSNEMLTKRNIKTIIDNAIVDSIGKNLQKYFKDGLEKFIRSRVESAVRVYNEETVSCYTSPTRASFSSRPKSKSRESVDGLRYQSSIQIKDVGIDCSIKTVCSDHMSVATESFEPEKQQKPSKVIKCKYNDITSWVNKRQRHKPVTAPIENKSILSIPGTESNRTIQILSGNTNRPYPYDRPFSRRFARRKFSKESIS